MNGPHVNSAPVNSESCKRVLDQLDRANDVKQLAETDPTILRHLETCVECSQEVRARLAMRERLRTAVRSFTVTPELERRIVAHRRPAFSLSRNVMLVAAALVLSAGTAITYRLGHLRLTPGAQESYIASISKQVRGVMRVGLGDHVHCAVFDNFPKNAPPADGALPAEYNDLVGIVRDRLPAGYRVTMAHRCHYHGREFIHLAASKGSSIISLVMTRKGANESFGRDQVAPILSLAGIEVYSADVQRFEIAGFETRGHLVWVISDLGGSKNLDLMAAIAPGVRDVLQRIEG